MIRLRIPGSHLTKPGKGSMGLFCRNWRQGDGTPRSTNVIVGLPFTDQATYIGDTLFWTTTSMGASTNFPTSPKKEENPYWGSPILEKKTPPYYGGTPGKVSSPTSSTLKLGARSGASNEVGSRAQRCPWEKYGRERGSPFQIHEDSRNSMESDTHSFICPRLGVDQKVP